MIMLAMATFYGPCGNLRYYVKDIVMRKYRGLELLEICAFVCDLVDLGDVLVMRNERIEEMSKVRQKGWNEKKLESKTLIKQPL